MRKLLTILIPCLCVCIIMVVINLIARKIDSRGEAAEEAAKECSRLINNQRIALDESKLENDQVRSDDLQAELEQLKASPPVVYERGWPCTYEEVLIVGDKSRKLRAGRRRLGFEEAIVVNILTGILLVGLVATVLFRIGRRVSLA